MMQEGERTRQESLEFPQSLPPRKENKSSTLFMQRVRQKVEGKKGKNVPDEECSCCGDHECRAATEPNSSRFSLPQSSGSFAFVS